MLFYTMISFLLSRYKDYAKLGRKSQYFTNDSANCYRSETAHAFVLQDRTMHRLQDNDQVMAVLTWRA